MRKDLNMRRGKQIAQGCHASMKVLLDRGYFQQSTVPDLDMPVHFHISNIPRPMEDWLRGLFTKIVVYVNSREELFNIYQKAVDAKLPCAIIQDAGLTEFKGVPTLTCCAIGPAEAEDVDKITGELPLL